MGGALLTVLCQPVVSVFKPRKFSVVLRMVSGVHCHTSGRCSEHGRCGLCCTGFPSGVRCYQERERILRTYDMFLTVRRHAGNSRPGTGKAWSGEWRFQFSLIRENQCGGREHVITLKSDNSSAAGADSGYHLRQCICTVAVGYWEGLSGIGGAERPAAFVVPDSNAPDPAKWYLNQSQLGIPPIRDRIERNTQPRQNTSPPSADTGR